MTCGRGDMVVASTVGWAWVHCHDRKRATKMEFKDAAASLIDRAKSTVDESSDEYKENQQVVAALELIGRKTGASLMGALMEQSTWKPLESAKDVRRLMVNLQSTALALGDMETAKMLQDAMSASPVEVSPVVAKVKQWSAPFHVVVKIGDQVVFRNAKGKATGWSSVRSFFGTNLTKDETTTIQHAIAKLEPGETFSFGATHVQRVHDGTAEQVQVQMSTDRPAPTGKTKAA